LNAESKEFLHDLLKSCGPSGFEEDTQKIWMNRTEKYAHEIRRDVMGNVVAILNPDAEFKIMIDGHSDEIGFIVNHISDEGFIHVDVLGGIDETVVPGSQVRIFNSNRYVDGVFGKKATHLEFDDEWTMKNLWIDIGAKNKKDAERVINVGDPATFVPNLIELRNGLFSSKGCDNRVGIYVASQVIKLLSRRKLNVGVYASSSTQEEVGLRGAKTSAFGIHPDVGFAVDVTWSSDTPHAEKKETSDVELGKGPVLHPGPGSNRVLNDLARKVGDSKKIPYQIQPAGYPGGTDADVIQLCKSGTAAILVSIPNRYMHTMVETCSYKDLDLSAKLIAETILKITPKSDFIPK